MKPDELLYNIDTKTESIDISVNEIEEIMEKPRFTQRDRQLVIAELRNIKLNNERIYGVAEEINASATANTVLDDDIEADIAQFIPRKMSVQEYDMLLAALDNWRVEIGLPNKTAPKDAT